LTTPGWVNYVWARFRAEERPDSGGHLVGEDASMGHFWEILTKPDNIPIVGMLLAVIFCLGVAFRQALKHDKLIEQGRKEDIYSEMIK
jgi:hypothetical protein